MLDRPTLYGGLYHCRIRETGLRPAEWQYFCTKVCSQKQPTAPKVEFSPGTYLWTL